MEKRQWKDATASAFKPWKKTNTITSTKLKFPFVAAVARFTNSRSVVLPSIWPYKNSRKKSKQVFSSNLSQRRL